MRQGRTKLLYLDDSYLREFDANVLQVAEGGVILDSTTFHPTGGGLISDIGELQHSGGTAHVREVRFIDDGVVHVCDGELPQRGMQVHGVIDWDRRYRVMRAHTALHALSAVVARETGALVTGNQVGHEDCRVDFALEGLDRELLRRMVDLTNSVLKEGRRVSVRWMSREEALRIPGITKLADRLPPEVPMLRLVEIEGVDLQADGGPHVANTRECGEIEVLGFESKGKRNKRLYFRVVP
ncbi:MAG: alanyl-tRNA editing protein [Thaumarchaeota archaeon]|nr:alanyl-tRNA editing protein [Candidatus Calditenuaceae archaeon]MDW8187200.1 alanyl-tRNA editing protein [Nitrososphaerota archaeon]